MIFIQLSNIQHCNIPLKAGNMCNILPKLVVSSGFIVFRLKRDLKYRDHAYFEPVRSHVTYQVVVFLTLIINSMNIKNVKIFWHC